MIKRKRSRLFFAVFIIRVFMMLVQQSYFVADEYWQSVEVAHRVVFGYGHLTWEWKEGIRSFLFPSMFVYLFELMKLLHIDTPFLVRIIPRLLMCAIQAIQDLFVLEEGGEKAFITYIFLWPTAYIGTRTLSNTLESLLFVLLYKYKSPVFLVVLSFWIRPTSIFASIFFFDFKRSFNLRNVVVGVLSVAFCCLYDAVYYYALGLDIPLCSPLQFFIRNIVNNVAVCYGSQPFLFYFYSCIPSLLGPLILLFYKCYKEKLFVFAMIYTLLISFVSHKEIRYLYSVLPFIVVAVGKYQTRLFMCINVFIHVLAMIFFGQFHQVSQGTITNFVANDPVDTLFLMPCHSTPFYSHVHANISMKFLECPREGFSETKSFLSNPSSFVSNISSPWKQIITYESFADNMSTWLSSNNYSLLFTRFNTFFFIDDINASHVSVYRKK